jgi:hypothetical protein
MAAPLAIACASLFAGVAAAPPLHPGQIGTDAALARATPVDGGGAVALTMPWDEPVAPANTTALGPPQILLPDGTATLAGLGSDVSSGGVPAVFVTGGTSGIPTNVLVAYHHAADTMTRTDPSCHLSWSVLAAIGKVESGHARGGAVDSSGRTLSPILGPVLSGGPYAAIRDTDGGRWDGNTAWDRAVGPMQFIPSSWRAHGVDGNGDGRLSVHRQSRPEQHGRPAGGHLRLQPLLGLCRHRPGVGAGLCERRAGNDAGIGRRNGRAGLRPRQHPSYNATTTPDHTHAQSHPHADCHRDPQPGAQ